MLYIYSLTNTYISRNVLLIVSWVNGVIGLYVLKPVLTLSKVWTFFPRKFEQEKLSRNQMVWDNLVLYSNQKKLSHAVCSHAQLTENGDSGLNLGCHQCEKLMLMPQFNIQLVYKPHFGTKFFCLGRLGSQGSKEKKSGF